MARVSITPTAWRPSAVSLPETVSQTRSRKLAVPPLSASCDSLEPILGDESEEFQGGSLRMLFTAFPLAHEPRCHVEIPGENCLARTLPQPQGADFRVLQRTHWRKTQLIKFTHCALLHYAGGMKAFCRLVDRRHQRTTVLFSHRKSPPSTFQTRLPGRWPCHHSAWLQQWRKVEKGLGA